MVVYSFSNFFIFFWFIFNKKAMLNTASWSASNFLGISVWKYWIRRILGELQGDGGVVDLDNPLHIQQEEIMFPNSEESKSQSEDYLRTIK